MIRVEVMNNEMGEYRIRNTHTGRFLGIEFP